MDTVDSDLPDVPQHYEILPYQFEPISRNLEASSSETTDESDADSDDLTPHQSAENNRLGNTDWCNCGNCVEMSTSHECICCTENTMVATQMREEGVDCVTVHQTFIENCLRERVLAVCMHEYVQNIGPLDDNEPSHELYRHLAYRRFVRWIWHRLGRHNRKILPACVVSKIRETFQSETYRGFQYARI